SPPRGPSGAPPPSSPPASAGSAPSRSWSCSSSAWPGGSWLATTRPPSRPTSPEPMSTGASTGAERDPFVDFVRAFSLLVVVAWHWVFTIIIWRDDGPHATNPIGFTKGLFVATWLLQVLPLFFFVGGFAHQQAWAAQQASGTRLGTFVWKRISALAR